MFGVVVDVDVSSTIIALTLLLDGLLLRLKKTTLKLDWDTTLIRFNLNLIRVVNYDDSEVTTLLHLLLRNASL